MHGIRACVLITLCLFVTDTTRAAEDVETVFAKAVQLLDAGRYAEALPLLQDVTNRAPPDAGAFRNLGIAATETGDLRLALHAYSRYSDLSPSDPRALSKLIQAHQAVGQLKERDEVREQLIAIRNALPADEREKMAFYVRDNFRVAGQHFMVLEYFEPRSPMRLYYKFSSMDRDLKVVYNFTLSSSDTETSVGREMGRIGKDGRIYGLDKNEGGTHTLYGLFKTLESYDAIKARVIDAVEGRLTPGQAPILEN